MIHSSLLRVGELNTPILHDVICTAPGCDVDADRDAPAPLCAHHVRLTFAYFMKRAQGLSDNVEAVAIEPPTANESGWVYFIRKGDLIKIGWTTHPKRRFKELRPDAILALMDAEPIDERRCHAAFAHLRVRGEWFRPEADLLAYIEGIKADAA
jgi:hypothetical protein